MYLLTSLYKPIALARIGCPSGGMTLSLVLLRSRRKTFCFKRVSWDCLCVLEGNKR